jgi:hypothetical protein
MAPEEIEKDDCESARDRDPRHLIASACHFSLLRRHSPAVPLQFLSTPLRSPLALQLERKFTTSAQPNPKACLRRHWRRSRQSRRIRPPVRRGGIAVALLARMTGLTSKLANELLARAYACDVGDPAAVERTFAAIESDLGSVDVLLFSSARPPFAEAAPNCRICLGQGSAAQSCRIPRAFARVIGLADHRRRTVDSGETRLMKN